MSARQPGLSADSDTGRCLLALRAGAMTASELKERFGGNNPAYALVRCGWVANDGEFFTLTEAGRAACPFRNPLAAAAATPPTVAKLQPEEIMVTKTEVLDQIKAAGRLGITRNRLLASFNDVKANLIDQHVSNLAKAGSIFKPKLGHLVAAEFPPPGADSAPAAQAPVAANNSASGEAGAHSSPADPAVATEPREAVYQTDSRVAPSVVSGDGSVTVVMNGDSALECDIARRIADDIARIETGPPIADDIARRAPGPRQPAPCRAEDGRDITFCIWDDGVLSIHMEGRVIDLPKEATARLAYFIGQAVTEGV